MRFHPLHRKYLNIPHPVCGQTQHKLTFTGVKHKDGASNWVYEAFCVCGAKINVWRGQYLKQEPTACRSCYTRVVVHGESRRTGRSRLYEIWASMCGRCYCKTNTAYKIYGAHGIAVDPVWLSFVGFKQWALSAGYTDNLSIDRIDSNGNYTPENCRWISLEENSSRATSKPVICLTTGEQFTSALECSRHFNISYSRMLVLCRTETATKDGLEFSYV